MTYFRGIEYPNNFKFISQYEKGTEPVDGTIVGLALAFIKGLGKTNNGQIIEDNGVLVWDQGGVIRMEKSRYKKKFGGNGTNGR